MQKPGKVTRYYSVVWKAQFKYEHKYSTGEMS